MAADAKLAWFPLYVRDWLLDEKVLGMTFAERGVYLHLLCLQWMEGSLPARQGVLERSLGIASSGALGDHIEIPTFREIVRDCFPPHPTLPGRLANPRLLQVWEAQQLEAKRRAEAGKKGGARSAQARLKPGSTKQDAEAEPEPETKRQLPQAAAANLTPERAYVLQVCVVANHGLAELTGGAYRPIVAEVEQDGGAGVEWFRSGIPVEIPINVIADRMRTYRVTSHNRQPRSLRYFDAAVREVFAKTQAKPKAGADPFGVAA